MSDGQQWHRVSKAHPCPICKRPDWCLISHDEAVALCARVESPSKCGESGWLHKLTPDLAKPPRWTGQPKPAATPRPGLDILAKQYQGGVFPHALAKLARQLGLTTSSLTLMGIGWTGYAWSFPMTDCYGGTLGVRLRFEDGTKRSVSGGKEGLFIPTSYRADNEPLMVCEGATDTAALLDMGFSQVIGRPSCNGGVSLIAGLVLSRDVDNVVVVADADVPGQRGAKNLAAAIDPITTVTIITPPSGIKDAREWLRTGGTKEGVLSCLR